MNGDAASSSDEEAGTGVTSKQAMQYLKKEQSKEIAKLRQQALIKGMQAGTSGIAQDCIYTILDLVSQTLVVAQLIINLKSVFGGEGCLDGHASSLEVIWFWTQMVLNALVTIGQFGLWMWGFFVTGMFCCSYQKCPTSKDAQCANPMIAYREFQARSEGHNLDDMDDDEKGEVLAGYGTDEELKRDEEFKAFKKELSTLGRVHSLQGSLTNFRAAIGALGAMVEPALAAYTGMQAPHAEDVAALTERAVINITEVANAGKEKAAAIAKDLADQAAAGAEAAAQLKKCMTARQVSATGSGVIAAIGIKQAAMKTSYTKLVMLAQMREKDIEDFQRAQDRGDPKAKRRVTDEAIETELQDLLGPQGKKYLEYLSGQQAPAE